MGNLVGEGLPQKPQVAGISRGQSGEIIADVDAALTGAQAEDVFAREIRDVNGIARRVVLIFRHGDDRSRLLTYELGKPLVGNRPSPRHHGTGNQQTEWKQAQEISGKIMAVRKLAH